MSVGPGGRLEQQRNAPDTGQCHHGVNNTGEQGAGTAANPGHQVKLEQPDATPVECTDDGDDQSELVHKAGTLLSLYSIGIALRFQYGIFAEFYAYLLPIFRLFFGFGFT